MKRLSQNRKVIELYESVDNLSLVRKKYFEAFDKLQHEEKISIIEGNRSAEAIAADVWSKVKTLMAPSFS